MTLEEALCWCNQFEDNIILFNPQNPKKTLALQAMKQCKEALEKQMPKKPKKLTYKLLIDSGWKYECPNCGCAIGVNKNLMFAYGEYLEPYENNCCSCGQALDWSDTE